MDADTADELGETETPTNGANTRAGRLAADKAAFLAGDLGDAGGKAPDKSKGKTPAPADDDDDEGDDADLDADDLDEILADDDDDQDGDTDDDADLDEDDEDEPDAGDDDEEEDVDAETKKRLAQVRKTDKRLRERRDADFKTREAELDRREAAIEERLRPHLEKLERFEKLAARASIDPAGILQALGVGEDRFEHAAQVLYTLAKAKGDPKAAAAAAQLMKERELASEVEDLKKWRADREKTDQEREQHSRADQQWNAFFDRVEKATSDKTPLAKQWLKANPAAARERITVLTYQLAKAANGSAPKERDVLIALEKDRRRALRELGIDPKTRAAAAAANTDSQTKTTPKGDKKTAQLNGKKPDGEKKKSPRDEFISLNGKYD